jgi:Ca2+-binding RTX toxin-like protein
MYGGTGNDVIDGSGGNDSAYGGEGNDYIYAVIGTDIADGGTGTDTLDTTPWSGDYVVDLVTGLTNFTSESYVNFENLISGAGNDTLTGTSSGNVIRGGEGNDLIVGNGGNDSLYGEGGNDVVTEGSGVDVADGGTGVDELIMGSTTANHTVNLATGKTKIAGESFLNFEWLKTGNGNDKLTGNNADNRIYAYGGNDSINGGNGNDSLGGFQGADTLIGGGGNDFLYGDEGGDRLTGGAGVDQLFGGIGADRFIFTKTSDSGPVASDTIRDGGVGGFEGAGAAAGDLIDLSKIDADTTLAGNQTFVFGGSSRGQVLVVDGGSGNSIVFANTDNDVDFEFRLLIEDGGVLASAYTAADFIL